MNFFKKYKWYLTIIMMILIYFMFYCSFIFDGRLPTGIGLKKSDWLAFSGSYLGAAATILVSLIALDQNKQLGSINNRLLSMQIAEKIPFIDAKIEKIEASDLDKIDKIIAIDKGNFNWYDGELSAVLKTCFNITLSSLNHKSFMKLLLKNVSNNVAIDATILCNGNKIAPTINLSKDESIDYILFFLDTEKGIDMYWKIEFKALDNKIYYQEFICNRINGSQYKFIQTGYPKEA